MRKQGALLANNFKASFLSCEKDTQTIWKKLFIESKPYSDKLKRLLLIDRPDCLDQSQAQYQQLINEYDLRRMKTEQYLLTVPRRSDLIHEDLKSTILLEFDQFTVTANPQYRDCTISFTIVCPFDCWELEDYQLRPFQIAGYIDGIMNETKLSGIGTLQYLGAEQFRLDNNYGGVMIRYTATHGIDDTTAINEDWPTAQ